MRRRWYSRFGPLLLACWFVLYATEPAAALHRCPMHDGSMGTMAMDASGSMPVAAHAPQGDRQPASSHHACTCMGDCAGAAFVALGGSSTSFVAVVVPAAHAQPMAATAFVPVAAAHVLPFSNGPPVRA